MPRASEGAGPSGSAAAQKSPAFRFAFLQILMQRGYMLDTDARALYCRLCSASNDAQYFDFIKDINQQLEFAHFELRRIKYPGDGQQYIGFVNREGDESSKQAAKHRGKDGKPDVKLTAFFKALLERIATEERGGGEGSSSVLGYISSTEALNLTVAPEAMTQATQGEGSTQAATQASTLLKELGKRDREAALQAFAEDGWLAAVAGRAGCYTLGPRSLLELAEFILSLDLPDPRRAALARIL